MSYGTKLTEPQKKRWITGEKHAPFPVPISSITGLEPSVSRWHHYTGELVGNVVLVKYSGDMEWLYNMGFFGKGTLSGSKPIYSNGQKREPPEKKRRHTDTETDKKLRLISRRKFLTHLSWARETGKISEREANINPEDHQLQLPLASKTSKKQKSELGGNKPDFVPTQEKPSQSDTVMQSGDHKNNLSGLIVQNSHEEAVDADWLKESHGLKWEEEEDPWAATSSREAEEFWGPSVVKETVRSGWKSEDKRSKWGDESEVGVKEKQAHGITSKKSEPMAVDKTEENTATGISDKGHDLQGSSIEGSSIKSKGHDLQDSSIEGSSIKGKGHTLQGSSIEGSRIKGRGHDLQGSSLEGSETDLPQAAGACRIVIDPVSMPAAMVTEPMDSESTESHGRGDQCSKGETSSGIVTTFTAFDGNEALVSSTKTESLHISRQAESVHVTSPCVQPVTSVQSENGNRDEISSTCPLSVTGDQSGDTKTDDIISSCARPVADVQSDGEGDAFVIDDTDDSEVETVEETRLPWRPVIKQDPFPLKEYLQLSLEEAFFLSYGLGCLLVLDHNKEALKLSQMWCTFCDIQPSFVHKYIAYHNFRSKGWVPKSGVKYGADFVVYKEGPPFYHSSYTVSVTMVDEASLENTASSDRHFSWTSLAGMNRVTEQVIKEAMFCHVIRPSSLKDLELRSPGCIPKFKIQEVILKRWVSSSEREHAEYILIP